MGECHHLTQKAEGYPRQKGRGRNIQINRDGGIRTHGPFVPNEVRYQAAPHPVFHSTRVAREPYSAGTFYRNYRGGTQDHLPWVTYDQPQATALSGQSANVVGTFSKSGGQINYL